ADLHALEVCCRAVGLRFARQHPEHVAGELTELYHGDDRLVLRLHLDGVIEGAGDDVGAAADQRLQGPRATGKIGNLQIEPCIAEVAEPLSDGQRQIEQRRLAADGGPHAGQFRLPVLCARDYDCRDQQERRRGGYRKSFHHPPHHDFCATVLRCSTSAQRASETMSLNVSKSTPAPLPAARPALRSATAASIARATRKITEVG